MPIVTSDVPRLLEAGLKTEFFEELAKLTPSYEKICTVTDTTQETTNYGWLGSPPSIREFTDERVAKGIAQYGLSIKDKTWEATIAVSRRELENDMYGATMQRIRQLAQKTVQGINKRAYTILREANTTTYGRSWDNYTSDGTLISTSSITFCDTDHSYPAPAEYTTSQINKATNALSTAYLWDAYNAMCAFKDDRGEYMENAPNMIVLPPKLHRTILEILTPVTVVAASATNYNNVSPSLSLEINVSPYWTADDAANTQNWMLVNTTGVVKPLILQLFAPALPGGQLFEFSALEGNSENGFMRDVFYYGIRSRFEIGYGDWRTAYLNVVA